MEKTGCKIICGAPTTLAIKELMMMMMMMIMVKASVMMISRNIMKKVGESRHPCRTPTVVWNQFPMLLLKKTAAEEDCTSGLVIELF